MKCVNGCAKCCHVDLSIYTSEATLILEWFKTLSINKKEIIVKNHSELGRCIFLDEKNSCLVYEVRPVICRTQGSLLLFRDEDNGQAYIDICPLNFENSEIPAANKALDLDRLNALLATCHQHTEIMQEVQAEALDERISMRTLFKIMKAMTVK